MRFLKSVFTVTLLLVAGLLSISCQPTAVCSAGGTTTTTEYLSTADACLTGETTTTSTTVPSSTTSLVSTTTSVLSTTTSTTTIPTTTITSSTPPTTWPALSASKTIVLFGDSNLSEKTPSFDHATSNSLGTHYVFEQYSGNGLTAGTLNDKYGPNWAAQTIAQLKTQYNPALIVIEMDSIDTLSANPEAFVGAVDALMIAAGSTPVIWFDVPSVNTIGKTLAGHTITTEEVAHINASLAAAQNKYSTTLWVISSDGINNTAFHGSCPVLTSAWPSVVTLQSQTNCYSNSNADDPHYNSNGYIAWGFVNFLAITAAQNGNFRMPAAAFYSYIQTSLNI